MSRLDLWWPFDRLAFAEADAKLTDLQSLARIRLLNYCWGTGGVIPLDAGQISRITRMSAKNWTPALAEFVETEDGWVHPTLTDEARKAVWISEKRAEAGRKGGEVAGKGRPKPEAIDRQMLKQMPNHACVVPVTVLVSSPEDTPNDRGLGGKVGVISATDRFQVVK